MTNSQKSIVWLAHFTFWGLLLGLAVAMLRVFFPPTEALLIGLCKISILALIAYSHANLVIPKLFQANRFGWYLLTLLGLIALSAALNYLFFGSYIERARPVPPPIPSPFGSIVPHSILTVVVLFFSSIYSLAQAILHKEKQRLQLEKEKITHELSFLRSQINPHFLFNALNNLQATIQLFPGRAETYVQRLAEMLRYVLEDCQKDQVSLKDEIQYIRNYIYFQQQKEEGLPRVDFNITGETAKDFYLEPMLFIAIVENAFQHSETKNLEDRRIDFHLHLGPTALQFRSINNLSDLPVGLNGCNRRGHGLGLQNVQRRLALLYPGRHELTHGRQKNNYLTSLTINRPEA